MFHVKQVSPSLSDAEPREDLSQHVLDPDPADHAVHRRGRPRNCSAASSASIGSADSAGANAAAR